MFSKATEGDKIWSPIHGWGEVNGVSENVITKTKNILITKRGLKWRKELMLSNTMK